MTGNVINLRQVRKQRERAAREKLAAENREKHGRTRAEREQVTRDAEAKARVLDGHWLNSTDAGAGGDPADGQDAPSDPETGKHEP